MKKNIILILLVAAAIRSSAQFPQLVSNKPTWQFTFGVIDIDMNNAVFSNWLQSNFNQKAGNTFGGNLDIGLTTKKWDAGFTLDIGDPEEPADIYFGRRLTAPRGNFSSFLNLEFGGMLLAEDGLVPVNPAVTPNQPGQKMDLDTRRFYIGLSSKNYFSISSPIGKGLYYSPGFFIKAAYMPFRPNWRYGYTTDDDSGLDADDPNSTTFHPVAISGIPNLNNFFIEAGIFISFSGKL